MKYYPDPDDSSKRQKVVVDEETQDIELTQEELKMAFRWVGLRYRYCLGTVQVLHHTVLYLCSALSGSKLKILFGGRLQLMLKLTLRAA